MLNSLQSASLVEPRYGTPPGAVKVKVSQRGEIPGFVRICIRRQPETDRGHDIGATHKCGKVCGSSLNGQRYWERLGRNDTFRACRCWHGWP